ncbi:MAG TPA: ATP-dependent helicase [Kiritimatiellia bacterium]|nr:ATP-dependent helicase [Kiritimatiellia bacterium]
MSLIDYSSELNEEQCRAVLAPDGPVLVIAAAGTGKTRTLTYRVAHLVERGIDARRILLLTFTNRAAREMLERAAKLVGAAVGGLWGGTFHHMANRILRRHADRLGYGLDYTILDQDDSRKLVKAISEELDYAGKHFPKPDVLLSLFGYAASTGESLRLVAEERFKYHDEINPEQVIAVAEAYEERKRRLNGMDFDDMLLNVLRLFRQEPGICASYQEQFQHILVDEYQDTNYLQSEWVDLLASKNRNLFVVGDDFQSIYSWRGANFRNILSFPERYQGAKVFKLETNYRSVPEILNVANACIAGNPEQFQKTLRSVRENYKVPSVAVLRDGSAQARYIIEQIARLKRSGYKTSEMAVLYRSHFHAMELQMELTRERIPYVITSGARFFEQAHIKDVCAIVRLLRNPVDELSFLRILEFLPRVGRRSAAKIWESLGGRFDASEQALAAVRAKLPAPARESWQAIETVITEITRDPEGAGAEAYMEAFVDGFYDEYAVETFDNYNRRQEDIQELMNYASQFATPVDFLSEMALLSNLDAEDDHPADDGKGVIRLSTIHQAKGLEWKVIFILWLADGMFPSAKSLEVPGGVSEERRLFYVATTRAKDELFLCVPEVRRGRDGSTQFCITSRFVEEIPEKLVSRPYVGFI